MVFGNMGDTSATGVGFTRNPSTGAKEFYGEFLQNAQGEDVVAGIRTPQPDRRAREGDAARPTSSCARSPRAWSGTTRTCRTSSSRSRTTRCTCSRPATASARALAAVHIAVDMVEEGILTKREAVAEGRAAVARPAPAPDLRPQGARPRPQVAAKGLPASPGAATGAVVFTADDAVAWSQKGKRVRARAHGDGARRHPRHERGPGHPHRDRRHDVARRGGGPPDGQAVGGRLRRARDRRQGPRR